jgi:RNA-binding protein 39
VLPKKLVMTRSQFTQQMLSGLKEKGFNDGPKDGPSFKKLWIKNLRPVVTEEDMRGIFKPFGEFDEFKMGTQECWITFQNHNDAQDAMGSMQGFQLVGQELQIVMQSIEVAPPLPAMPPPPPQESLEDQIAKDTDFGSAGSADSAGKIELMKKLMSSHQAGGIPTVAGGSGGPAMPPPPPPAGVPPPPPPTNTAMPPTPKPGGPTARTLLLQNMFTPGGVNLQKDPRFYEEIREDTNEECSKFGKVLHVTVDPRGSTGLIYVLYENPGQRQAAELALNGRWFEGKKIMAAGIDDTIWQALAAQAVK